MPLPDDAIALDVGGLPSDAVPLPQATGARDFLGRTWEGIKGVAGLGQWAGRGVGALGGSETAQNIATGLGSAVSIPLAATTAAPIAAGEAARPIGEGLAKAAIANQYYPSMPGVESGMRRPVTADTLAQRRPFPPGEQITPEERAAAVGAAGEAGALGISMLGQGLQGAIRPLGRAFRAALNYLPGREAASNRVIQDAIGSVPGLIAPTRQETQALWSPLTPEVLRGERVPLPSTMAAAQKVFQERGGNLSEGSMAVPEEARIKLRDTAQSIVNAIKNEKDVYVGLDRIKETMSDVGLAIRNSRDDLTRGSYRYMTHAMWDDIRGESKRTGSPIMAAYEQAVAASHREHVAQDLAEAIQGAGTEGPRAAVMANPDLTARLKRLGAFDDVMSTLSKMEPTLGAVRPERTPTAAKVVKPLVGAAVQAATGGGPVAQLTKGPLASLTSQGLAYALVSRPGRMMIKAAMKDQGMISPQTAIAAALAGRTAYHRAFELSPDFHAEADASHRRPEQVPPDAVVLDLSKPVTGAQP